MKSRKPCTEIHENGNKKMRNFNIPHSVQQCWFIRHILVSLSTTAVLLYLLKHYSTVRKTPREYLVCSCSFGRSCALSPHILQLVDKRLPRFLCRRGHVHCPSFLPASTSCTHRSETKTTCRGISTLYLLYGSLPTHFYKEDYSQFRRRDRHCGTRGL